MFSYIKELINLVSKIGAFLVCFLFSFSSSSQQLSYSKERLAFSHQFNYAWKDSAGQEHKIAFEIPNSDLFKPFRSFKTFKAKHADNFVYLSIKKELRKKPIEGAQISFEKQQNEGTKVSIKTHSADVLKQAQETLSALENKYKQQYLDDNYYALFTTADGDMGVKPDHVRFANESVNHLKPIASVFAKKINRRDARVIVNIVLSFVQSIPYSTLESRITSSGSGFNPPPSLLYQNQGDCDSKVTLMASILKSILPRLDIVIIYIPNHALIGVQIPYKDNEEHIDINGIDYLLAEPTGPAIVPIGTIGDDSLQMIASGNFVAERF